ncbi:SET domain-containing protein, partial [Mollisia scopiformis]
LATMSQPNTIYLTTEEDERMRKTLKGRLTKCQEVSGQPRVPGDPNTRQNQVAMASLLSDFAAPPEPGLKAGKGRPDAIVAFAVGNPYPPCTVSVQDLKPMNLSDLRMETHHRGHVLTVRRVAPVVKLVASSWTVVEEESSGETERLEISLHKSNHGQEILDLGSLFQIKEPYFTLNDEGGPTIRIDHPSDLFCTDTLPTGSSGSSPEGHGESGYSESGQKTARDFKEEGNAALKEKALLLAHTKYTHGLQLLTTEGSAKEELAYDLFRNRAHVNLALNRLDEAKTDGLAAVTGLEDQKYKELDSKAYFRAGCAAYNLGEFDEAKHFFEEQQRLMPSHKDAAVHIRKTEVRLKEKTIGVYDFKKIKAGLLTNRLRVDVTTFSGNVEIKESPGHGRGLFPTCAIKSGEIVLAEKAFCVIWGHEDEALTAMTYDNRDDRIRVCPVGLCKAIVQKLSDNPSQVEKVMALFSDYKGLDKQLIVKDSKPVIDTFQIHDIVARNAFGPDSVYSSGRNQEDADGTTASAGLWVLAAYINHSCIHNAKKESMGDFMVLRATRAIAAGEEITHSYDSSSDYDARSAELMKTWGFTCDCALCTAEKNDSPAVRKKRRELENDANLLVERNAPVGAKTLSIVKARRLVKLINDTYDVERYKGLPRLALSRIQKWLNEASNNR